MAGYWKLTYWFVLATLVVFTLILGIVWWLKPDDEAEVNNFEECAAAGHPVMESYPRQCATLDGRNFVEEIGD